jgi:hypothetical protein
VDATLTIDPRFCGPPGAGNGGYVGGLLAGLSGGEVEVTIRRAVPLGRPLEVTRSPDGRTILRADGQVIAEALRSRLDVTPPPPPAMAEAEAASRRFPRFTDHPVPRCFVCGIERRPGDGLRIFPGPVEGTDRVAAPWTPDDSLGDESGRVRAEFLWAALDCTGAFAVNEPPAGLALLGRLAARIVGVVRVGEPAIVIGWPIGREGRKLYPGTAIFAAAGELRAVARATWVLTEPKGP